MATERKGSLLYLEHAEYTEATCSRCGKEVSYLRINRAIKNVFTMLMVERVDLDGDPVRTPVYRPHVCERTRPKASNGFHGETGRPRRIGGDS